MGRAQTRKAAPHLQPVSAPGAGADRALAVGGTPRGRAGCPRRARCGEGAVSQMPGCLPRRPHRRPWGAGRPPATRTRLLPVGAAGSGARPPRSSRGGQGLLSGRPRSPRDGVSGVRRRGTAVPSVSRATHGHPSPAPVTVEPQLEPGTRRPGRGSSPSPSRSGLRARTHGCAGTGRRRDRKSVV